MKKLCCILFIIFATTVFHAISQHRTQKEAGCGACIEFDSEGVTDIGVEVGSNIVSEATQKETGIEDKGTTAFGAEARWGWNSGGSIARRGLTNGLNIK